MAGCYVLLSENRAGENHGFGSHTVMYAGESGDLFDRVERHPYERYVECWRAIGREVNFVLFTESTSNMLRNVLLNGCRVKYEGRLFYLFVPRFAMEGQHMAMKNAGILRGRTDQVKIDDEIITVLDQNGNPYVKGA